MRELVTQALAEKLQAGTRRDKPWLKSFGKLRGLHKETTRIDRIILAEFGRIEPKTPPPGPNCYHAKLKRPSSP